MKISLRAKQLRTEFIYINERFAGTSMDWSKVLALPFVENFLGIYDVYTETIVMK